MSAAQRMRERNRVPAEQEARKKKEGKECLLCRSCREGDKREREKELPKIRTGRGRRAKVEVPVQ
eukprot:1475363-Rhodomonas_salina.1